MSVIVNETWTDSDGVQIQNHNSSFRTEGTPKATIQSNQLTSVGVWNVYTCPSSYSDWSFQIDVNFSTTTLFVISQKQANNNSAGLTIYPTYLYIACYDGGAKNSSNFSYSSITGYHTFKLSKSGNVYTAYKDGASLGTFTFTAMTGTSETWFASYVAGTLYTDNFIFEIPGGDTEPIRRNRSLLGLGA